MRYRELGTSGIRASVIGCGAWAIGGWMWGGTEEKSAVRALQTAVDCGMNLIDTAPMYGFGRSEEIVGRAIQGRRDQVVLATKCGLVWNTKKGDFFFYSDEFQPRGEPCDKSIYRYLHPDSIRLEVEASLRRLRTDVIDLYQTHWQESTTAIADTMVALMKLKKEGKIRAIGCSNATSGQMDQYRAAGVLDTDQERYSMLNRQVEAEQLPYCAAHGLGFLAYSPLSQGLLTGKIGPDRQFAKGDLRAGSPEFNVESRQRVAAILDKLRPIADKHQATLGQLALAWAVHQAGCTHALAGARTAEQVQENARAGDLTLSADDLAAMRNAIMPKA